MSGRLVAVVIPPTSSRRGPGNGLGLEVLLETVDAVLPPDAALLVAAERHVRAVGAAAVDVDRAGADPLGHGERAVERCGEDAAGQAVVAVVGDPDCVVVVLERDDDEDGAEDLLLRDR